MTVTRSRTEAGKWTVLNSAMTTNSLVTHVTQAIKPDSKNRENTTLWQDGDCEEPHRNV
jgi:hypothetical protein